MIFLYDVWFPYMNIKIKNLERVAFSIFGLDIYFYGIIICLGILCGLYITLKEAKRTYQDENLYTDYLFYAIIFGIIGARIYYVIFSWDDYKNNLIKIFALREGGIAIYGAIIAAFLTAVFFCKKRKCNFNLFADTCTFGLLTGQIIGRWGNFFNREAFGKSTNSFFAMRYLASKVSFIPNNVTPIIIDGYKYIQVHPTFLYESLWNLFLLIFLLSLRKHKLFDGEIFLLYILFYGVGRFWIERLRTDQLLLYSSPISQLLSLILSFGALFILCKKYFFTKKNKS